MKKFSIAPIFLVLTSVFILQTSSQAIASNKTKCDFLLSAPDKHVVVRGNTLWGISEKFLENAWCWPKVWGMNIDQIRDPHWIYPGQIVYFDRATGQLRLGSTPNDIRLSPKIRSAMRGQEAVPTISIEAIAPFMSGALIVEESELNKTPRIMATQKGRVYLSLGDRAYVRGDLNEHTVFDVYRPGKALKDPETGEALGYEATQLGKVELHRESQAANEAHAFTVTQSEKELGIGDRLLHAPEKSITNFVPHAPDVKVDARVVAIQDGATHAGQNQIVPINRGKDDGLDVGSVLTLFRAGETVEDPTDEKRPVKLPDEEFGTLLVFRVFNKLSYGMVMDISDTVRVGDIARTPH